MKTLLVIFLFAAAAFVVWGGFYPVALVANAPIFAREWKKSEDAAKNFANARERSLGRAPIDFSHPENVELLLGVKRDTLTFLIEDLIVRQEGRKVVEGFELLSRERVYEAVRRGKNLEEAARLTYGLSLDEFRSLVLLPQARIDVLREEFQTRGVDFGKWLAEVKKKKNVRLLFTPFTWDGEMVR